MPAHSLVRFGISASAGGCFDRHAEISFLIWLFEKRDESMKDKIIEIHNDDYMLHEDIRFRYIQFFMYAEGGAMGEAGAVYIITQKEDTVRYYHANCVFGDFKWRNVVHIFPQFDKTFNHSNDLFDHVDLGMGNHLFVRKALKKEFDAAFEFKTSRVEMYQQWFDVAKELLKNKSEWKYCVVGNIVHERIDKAGILRYGTAQFSGGTRVYLCGRCWNSDREDITVIGLNRRNHYEATEVPVSAIKNVRCARVYKPKVLEIMNNFEFWQYWWGNAPEDKKAIEAFVKQWNQDRMTERTTNYNFKEIFQHPIDYIALGKAGFERYTPVSADVVELILKVGEDFYYLEHQFVSNDSNGKIAIKVLSKKDCDHFLTTHRFPYFVRPADGTKISFVKELFDQQEFDGLQFGFEDKFLFLLCLTHEFVLTEGLYHPYNVTMEQIEQAEKVDLFLNLQSTEVLEDFR